MKHTAKKLLLILAIAAVMTAMFAVGASAYVNWDATKGTFPGGTASSYADINNANWVQVAAPAAVDNGNDGVYTNNGDLVKGYDCNAYFNESTGTLVIEMTKEAAFTGSSGDSAKAQMLANWCKLNASKVTTLEFRNVVLFNNAGLAIDQLSSVKTVKINAGCTAWSGTKNGTAVFYNLTSMDTLLWGEWDKETGKFTKTGGEEGVVDLRGFTHLVVASTTYNDTHTLMYAGSAIAASGTKKVILPSSQTLRNPAQTYNLVVVSDGTYTDLNKHANNTNYGNVIAEGKPCTVIKNKETGELGYTTYWALDTTTWSNVTVKAAEDEFGGDYTGIIPYRFAMNATSLTTVIAPSEMTVKLIEASAFAGCVSLRCITVEGRIDPEIKIDPTAFTSVANGCIIQCANAADIDVLNAALAEAGIANVKAVDMSVEPTPAPTITKLPASPAWTAFDPETSGATAYGSMEGSYVSNWWAYYQDTKTLKFYAKKSSSYNEVGSIASCEDGADWTAYKEEIEHVVIGPKIQKLTAAFASGMTNLKDIEMTADISQASGSFADNASLTTIFITGMDKVEGQAMLAGAKTNFKLNLSGTAVKSIHMGSSALEFIGNITPGAKTVTLIFDTPSDAIIAYCEENYLNIKDSDDTVYGEWYVEVPEGMPFCGNAAVYEFDAETGTLYVLGKGPIGDTANYWGGGSKNQYWFDVKKQIKHVVIGDNITSIGKYAFTECENLETVQLPAMDGFTILNAAFEDCYNLKSVYIKGNEPVEGTADISILNEVESYMFADCFLIANVVINENVSKIGVSVFENCVNLQNVYGVSGSYAEEFASKNDLSFFDTATNTPQPIKCEPPAQTTPPETTEPVAPETTDVPATSDTTAPDTAPDTTPDTHPTGGNSEDGSGILPVIIVIAAVVAVAVVVAVVIAAKKKAPKAEAGEEKKNEE